MVQQSGNYGKHSHFQLREEKLSTFIRLGGSGKEKKGGGNDASLHSAMFDSARVRGVFRCYDAIDRVVEWAITFLVKSSLRVKAEQSKKRQRFCSFVLFPLPVPVQIRIHQPIFVKKKLQN